MRDWTKEKNEQDRGWCRKNEPKKVMGRVEEDEGEGEEGKEEAKGRCDAVLEKWTVDLPLKKIYLEKEAQTSSVKIKSFLVRYEFASVITAGGARSKDGGRDHEGEQMARNTAVRN